MHKSLMITTLFLVISISSNAQCAMCRAVLESGSDQKVAEGVNNGIMYLMIIPYILIAVVGYFVYKSKKN
ncbi:MAG: hypothetical protein CL613_09025 [Aquimarina sp.]|nr:hypothetical protein [Aquimarina sp.]